MAKEIPYFKFYPNDWSSGDITLEDYEVQGIFINVCAYYWSKDCYISILNLRKRFRGFEDKLDYLFSQKIIKKNGDNVIISFLDEQLSSKELQKAVNKMNGRLGGRPKKEKTEEKPNGLNFENQNETETKPIDKDIERRRKEILNNILLSELKNSDVQLSSRELELSKIAISFIEVFKANQILLGNENVKHLNEAKFKAYTDPIRLLMDSDGYKKEDIQEVYKYIKGKNSMFWKPNVLSTEKLRKQFGSLLIEAKKPISTNGSQVQAETPAYAPNNNRIDHSNREEND